MLRKRNYKRLWLDVQIIASVKFTKFSYNSTQTVMTTLNQIGQRLAQGMTQVKQWQSARDRERAHAEKVNVVGAGGSLTAAYEQLRNAAENTEEHLLLQNAIKRFYKQLFITRDERLIQTSGNELVVELTFAGYVPNDTVTRQQIDDLSRLAVAHYGAYEALLEQRAVSSDRALKWTLDVLAVKSESLFNDHSKDGVFIDFASSYYTDIIPQSSVKKGQESDYGALLFAAIHKALLKSDDAAIRTRLLERYRIEVDNLASFVAYNKQIDSLLEPKAGSSLMYMVDRQGAPLRILRHMIEEKPDFGELLTKRETFLQQFEQQVDKEYSRVAKRINRAIVRSVIFLIITKFLIGIAIEVPYDLWAHGSIIWLPLIINLLFPPIYMVLLRFTNTLPGYANTSALVDRADKMLYGKQTMLMKKQLSGRRYGPIFSVVYVISGLVMFAAVTWLLLMLGFSLVHIFIFFIFISAASFLGFRLSRLIRELEVVRGSSNGLTFVRDLIYLPFVVVGRWMSSAYSQVNVVTIVLDMLIELPLKTILRLIRQWGQFIDDRKDRI